MGGSDLTGMADEYSSQPIYALLRNEPEFPGYEPSAQFKRWEAQHALWRAECATRDGRLVRRDEIISVASDIWEDEHVRMGTQNAGMLSPLSPAFLRQLEDVLDEYHAVEFREAPMRALRFVEPILRRFSSGLTKEIALEENRDFFDTYYRGDQANLTTRLACPGMYAQTVASFLVQSCVFLSDFELNPNGWSPEEMRDPDNPRYAAFKDYQSSKSQARLAGGVAYCEEPETSLIFSLLALVLKEPARSPTSAEARELLVNYRPQLRRFAEAWKPEMFFEEGVGEKGRSGTGWSSFTLKRWTRGCGPSEVPL